MVGDEVGESGKAGSGGPWRLPRSSPLSQGLWEGPDKAAFLDSQSQKQSSILGDQPAMAAWSLSSEDTATILSKYRGPAASAPTPTHQGIK